MKPKRKSAIDYILPALGILFILWLCIELAMSYDAVKHQQAYSLSGTPIEGINIVALFTDLSERVDEKPLYLRFTESTPKFIGVGAFVLLLTFAYISTSKKKYITGTEYGSSQWATHDKIKGLEAKSLFKQKKKEIKKISDTNERERELDKAKRKYGECSNTIYTQTEKICFYNTDGLNDNTLAMGGSGSRKTTSFVLANILQCDKSEFSPSLVISDPKGEILAKSGKFLEKMGYIIKVLNLKELKKSYGFNPYKYVRRSEYEDQISSIVENIFDAQDNKNNSSKDPFWEQMAKVYTKALFFAVYEVFNVEDRNICTVMRLFRWFEIEDKDNRYIKPTKLDEFFFKIGDKYGARDTAKAISAFYNVYRTSYQELTGVKCKNSSIIYYITENIGLELGSTRTEKIEKYRNEIKKLLQTIKENNLNTTEIQPYAEKALSAIQNYIEDRKNNYASGRKKPLGVYIYEDYGDVDVNPALKNWEDFRTKCKGRTASSVLSTALAKLSPFDESDVRHLFEKDELELDLVGERKTALFVTLPPTKTKYNFIANVMYTQLFEQLEYCATVKHEQVLPVRVKIIMDEFYNTGRINNFEHFLSYARSFGIGISIIIQSLAQIKEMYEKNYGVIIDNCSVLLYLGNIRDEDTLKWISNMLGDATFDKRSYSITKGTQSSSSTSNDVFGRKLMDYSEVQKIPRNKCLLFINGLDPFYSNKFNYFKHRNFKFTSDYSKKNLYTYEPPVREVKESMKKSNHGEEKEKLNSQNQTNKESLDQQKQKVPKKKFNIPEFDKIKQPKLIEWNTDTEDNAEFIRENILFMDLAGQRVETTKNEEVELTSILQAEKEHEETKNNVNELLKQFMPQPQIKISSNSQDMEDTAQEFKKHPDRLISELPNGEWAPPNISVEEAEAIIKAHLEDLEQKEEVTEEFKKELLNFDVEMLDDSVQMLNIDDSEENTQENESA